MGYTMGICTVLTAAPVFTFMCPWKLLYVAACALVIWAWGWRRSQRRWRFHVDGHVEPGFEQVAQVFRKSIESKQEQGAAFSVYHKGELVVDLWGGYADFGALRLRKRDSTSMFYSATKAVTAIVLGVLADRGLLDYEAPVGKYWPEFGQNGKKEISVKTLLSHRAGLIAIKEKHKLAYIRDDPEKLSYLLAKQEPFWNPGTAQGYQTLTYGLYADQIVRRVDPKGRTLGDFFQEEIAQPFDIDFYIGEPPTQHYRACRETRASFGLRHFFSTTIPTGVMFVINAIYSLFLCRAIHLLEYVGNPTDWKPRRLNDPRYRELQCGASHGFGTARGVAKLMGILANGGTHEGKTLLSQPAIEALNTPLSSEFDRVVLRHITYGPGTTIMKIGKKYGKEDHYVFGHWGAGGQMAFADPSLHLGWTYVTNYCNILHGYIMDHRYTALQNAMYQCVYAISKQKNE